MVVYFRSPLVVQIGLSIRHFVTHTRKFASPMSFLEPEVSSEMGEETSSVESPVKSGITHILSYDERLHDTNKCRLIEQLQWLRQ